MDTYEENNRISDDETEANPADEQIPEQPIPEEESPAEQTSPEESCYHGAGVGVVESTGGVVPPAAASTADASADQPSPTPGNTPPKSRRHFPWKKLGKRAVAAVVVLALVACGSAGSAVLMNGYWQHQNKVLQKNFDERITVLQEQLESYQNQKHEEITVSVEGMTPAQIYNQNIESIVAVNCTTKVTENGKTYQATSAGSGFVFTADGYVVTNHHVIDGASTISVAWYDGTTMDAVLIGSDSVNDIALLKVEAENLRPVSIGNSSDLQVGDQVVAIGNALGELSFSLTVGYVSGTDRSVTTDGTTQTMIQTDASLNSGNSGGPLFNAKGEVIGITTAKYSGTTSSGASIEGIGFAIPMDDVHGMLEDLQEYGYIKSAYLGVMVRDVDAMVSQMYRIPMGANVESVTTGSCAQRAGIQPGDIIVQLGGYEVESLSDLTRVLRNFEPGEEKTIVVWRAGGEKVLTIVFDEKPQA